MKVTDITRGALASRREARRMKLAGYRYNEMDWRIHRGALTDHEITEVEIAVHGKGVYYKLERVKS